MKLILKFLLSGAAILLLAYAMPSVQINDFGTALVVVAVMSLLNTFVKPLFQLLALPVTVLTFGLFLFVINAILVILADNLITGFHISGFFNAIVFSILYSLVMSAVGAFVDEKA